MKVFDLQCTCGYQFEGWFASDVAYDEQVDKKLLSCPACSAHDITKLPTAPHVQRKSNQAPRTKDSAGSGMQQLQKLESKMLAHVLEHTVDVGEKFPEEARKIHYGESAERNIRGQATVEEAQALKEEGIDIVSLPFNARDKKKLQ